MTKFVIFVMGTDILKDILNLASVDIVATNSNSILPRSKVNLRKNEKVVFRIIDTNNPSLTFLGLETEVSKNRVIEIKKWNFINPCEEMVFECSNSWKEDKKRIRAILSEILDKGIRIHPEELNLEK